MTGEQDGDDSNSRDNDREDYARSQNLALGIPPGTPPRVPLRGLALVVIPPISLSNCFENRGGTLIEKNAIKVYNYY